MNNQTSMNQATKVITGEVRFSYLHVFEKCSIDGGDEKYSVSLLIPKTDKKTITAINKAIEAAKQAGIGRFGGKIPAVLKLPLRDGDDERPEDESYAGCYFVNANCTQQPGLVYKNGQRIIDSTDLYSGCYGLASINFYAFNSNGNKGIACGLNHLMKTRDGEPLGGRSRVEDDFAAYFDDEADEDYLS